MNRTALTLPEQPAKPRTRPDDGDRRRHPARPVHRPDRARRRVHRLRQVRLGHLHRHQLPAREDRRARQPRHRLLLRRHAVREVRHSRTASRTSAASARSTHARHVEVSNGTIEMSNSEKAGYIRKLAGDFTVVSEVGFKDSGRSEMLPPSAWVAVDQGRSRRGCLDRHPRGPGERQFRHLPAGRRAQVRTARRRAVGRHRRSTSCSSRRPTPRCRPT